MGASRDFGSALPDLGSALPDLGGLDRFRDRLHPEDVETVIIRRGRPIIVPNLHKTPPSASRPPKTARRLAPSRFWGWDYGVGPSRIMSAETSSGSIYSKYNGGGRWNYSPPRFCWHKIPQGRFIFPVPSQFKKKKYHLAKFWS